MLSMMLSALIFSMAARVSRSVSSVERRRVVRVQMALDSQKVQA